MKDLKERAVRGGLARLCGQAANLVLRLGFMVIMARLLDPEDFGLVAMVTVVTGVYEIFTTAGLSSATIQKATRHRRTDFNTVLDQHSCWDDTWSTVPSDGTGSRFLLS